MEHSQDLPDQRPRRAYPYHLASFVSRRWSGISLKDTELEHLLSVCFQASLMREEERPVDFRIILLDPESVPPDAGPPGGLHALAFSEKRPFDEDELRRLSPASDFERSLIGVERDGEGGFRIWGLVQSGQRWVKRTQGGREYSPPLPETLVVYANAPGRIEVRRGSRFVGRLERGEILGNLMDVFASRWLGESYGQARMELATLHDRARREVTRGGGEAWAPLDGELTRMIGQHAIRRMISVLRDSRHGGMILFIPPNLTDDVLRPNSYLNFKHRFDEGDPRRRFRRLIVGVTNRLAALHGKGGASHYPRAVGWREYQETKDPEIADLDEAIFELSHLIAALASVDGAVVMDKRFDLLGFGAEISASLSPVKVVEKALDLEGRTTATESTDGVGTRHRAAYRFVCAVPESVAVVVSQDGSARFVTGVRADGESPEKHDVTYWDHA